MLLKLIKSLGSKKTAAGLNERAMSHYQRGELERAEQLFREIAAQNPDEVSAWVNLAAAILKQQRYAAAVPVLTEIIELQPDLAEAHLDLGVCRSRLQRNTEAIESFRKAIALKPALAAAHASMINAHLDCCDWDAVDRWTAELLEYKERHGKDWVERLDPFCALTLFPAAISREAATCRAAAVERSIQGGAFPAAGGAAARAKDRIRVGYVSSDFQSHSIAYLTFDLYQAHDRREFEIYAYSTGRDDGSMYRKHIEQTCDRFFDVRSESAELTARRIRADEIDVLVEMNGHTANNRLQIFAYRPAPLQLHYLGYPGTTGASFIDYFISDHVATPPGYEDEFTEKLVYLRDCYQINDARQPISPHPLSRSDFGLPEDAFVYASFNTPRKIDRAIFSVWMEILRKVPGSVLWLVRDDPQAESNLRGEAGKRGVDPERLRFAEKTDKAVHLARHRLADLFLDTYVYNGHTTTSAALWAGVPVLTCPGATFARRVAASLLHAAGLPELIARDLEEYEHIAVRMARERELLAGFRNRLNQTRTSCALFDTPRYVRNLESAYRGMMDMHRNGHPPRSFSVSR